MEQTVETKTTEVKMEKKKYWWKATASFLMVLFTMPLGHAVMILMEHFLDETTLHYSAFAMGFVGMLMVMQACLPREIRARLCGDCSAVCCSGRDGWNSCLCILPTVSAHSRNSTL